jgi:hypothetical protein
MEHLYQSNVDGIRIIEERKTPSGSLNPSPSHKKFEFE